MVEERYPMVLIVDDDPLVRETAVAMFQELGCTALDTWHPHDALLSVLERPDIRLLMADIRMPVMNGIHLVELARLARPDLAVALTSAYVDRAPRRDIPFVRKPWRLDDFVRLGQRTAVLGPHTPPR